jgi:hypothetical protein
MMESLRTRRTGRLAVLVSILVALLAIQVRADGGPPSGEDPSSPSSSSPGDEVTSLPVAGVDPSGLTLVGLPGDIRSVVLSVEGRGQVFVTALGHRRVAVTLMGDYRVAFDRRNLALGNVRVLFRGGSRYGDGVAALSVAGGSPSLSSAERIQLPAARLAATGFTGVGLELVVRNGDSRAQAMAGYRADRVIWTQRLR